MILRSEVVTQVVAGDDPLQFVKELVQVPGPQPLAMVRKRLPPERMPLQGYRAPVLLLHGFGQNRYAWHLSARSFVNYLAREGFDVFNLDLRGHGRSRHLGARAASAMDEYVREDLPAALAEVRTLTDTPRVFVIGHSLGGLVAFAAASEVCHSLAGIVAIGSPYHFGAGSTALTILARIVSVLSELGLLSTVQGRLPIRWIGRWMHLYRHAWDNPRLPLPVRAWLPGAFEPSLLEEYLLRTFDTASVGTLVQLTRLAIHGSLRSADGTMDYSAQFEACDLPLLVIAGAHDRLAPPASVRPAYERSRSSDKNYREVPCGHADLLVGRQAPTTTWPLVGEWLHARANMAHQPDARNIAPHSRSIRHGTNT